MAKIIHYCFNCKHFDPHKKSFTYDQLLNAGRIFPFLGLTTVTEQGYAFCKLKYFMIANFDEAMKQNCPSWEYYDAK